MSTTNPPLPARVLLVSDSYPPLTGGATLAAQQLARDLAGQGVAVTVATAWQPGAPAVSHEPGVVVHRLRSLVSRIGPLSSDPTRNTPPPFADPELVWRLWRLVRTVRPDLVHTYGWLSYSMVLAAGRRRRPTLLSHRDYGMVCPKRTLTRDDRACPGASWRRCPGCASAHYGRVRGLVSTAGVLGARPLLRATVDATHSCSRFVHDVVATELHPRGPHVVLPDYRDDADPAVRPPDGLPTEPFILYVGALRLAKGIDVLLSAYARLRADGGPVPPLVLIGQAAPDTPPLPDGVIVLAPVPRDQVLAAWDRAGFGVAPSRWPEPLGNVVHEAMSRGRPVIGSRVGGHGQMITDGVDGLLIDAGDPACLAAAMRRLVDDPGETARLGRAARASAERFTRAAVLPQFLDLYSSVWARGRRGGAWGG